MKKVSLFVPIADTSGIITVVLGNGYKYEFTQARKADKFLQDCSKFLTDRMYLINELYSDLYSSYRRLWGFFHHNKETYSFKLYREEREIKESFENCENLLERLWSLTVKAQTNYLVFYDLKKSLRELINVNLKLNKMVLNNPMESIKLDHLLRSLQGIEGDLNTYQVSAASGVDSDLRPVIELKIAN